MGVRFFTLPPRAVPWPFVLINAVRPDLHYLAVHRRFVRSVIIDSGVEIFRDPQIKDYPPGWFDRLTSLYRKVRELVPGVEVWVTVPDYPDDYHPGALWLDGKTNIERTLDNILHALGSYPEVSWLIPVQGHNRRPSSVVHALELYARHDVPLDRYLAIANLCVEKSGRILEATVKLAHDWLMSHGVIPRIHVFGPSVAAIKRITHLITSFDSTAWTRPRVPNGWSAKTEAERVWLFITWVHKYASILELPYEVVRSG